MRAWINGSFVDDSNAKISAFDAGFQHGVGLFETMSAKNGVVFRATEHVNRLANSASMLRLTEKLETAPLVEALQQTLQENNQQESRIRLTISGGDLNMLQQTGSSGSGDPTVVIQTQPPTQYPDAFFDKGVLVSIASGRSNPYEFGAGHKTLNYWSKLLNLQLAAMQQCGEAIWLTPSANITGGSVSNLFAVRNGTLFTPTARGEEGVDEEPSATLPGITRNAIIGLADELGTGTNKTTMVLDDVLGADEVFLTNSSWGVLPVAGIRATVQTEDGSDSQDEAIGGGCVGRITSQLINAYRDCIEAETGQ